MDSYNNIDNEHNAAVSIASLARRVALSQICMDHDIVILTAHSQVPSSRPQQSVSAQLLSEIETKTSKPSFLLGSTDRIGNNEAVESAEHTYLCLPATSHLRSLFLFVFLAG